jgi:hypothetical protein
VPQQPAREHPPAKPGLTDDRIRELHRMVIDAKRSANEAAKVSIGDFAKSLRDAEQRLRQKHGDRSVDFSVAVKDGKVVVKPVLR